MTDLLNAVGGQFRGEWSKWRWLAMLAVRAKEADGNSRMPRVLIAADYYLPGFQAGGPIRTLSNLVEALGSEIQFVIATRNRDLGSSESYPGIEAGQSYNIGKAEVRYFSGEPRYQDWKQLLSSESFDILYLNSFFSPRFSISPLAAWRFGGVKSGVIVAPRGEFSNSALKLKRTKKLAYVQFARASGTYRRILWHASSEYEAEDIWRWFGSGAEIWIAANVSTAETRNTPPIDKAPGLLRLVFLSRISRMKNLHWAIEMLAGIAGNVELSIYGPIEDASYWAACMRLLDALPKNISYGYFGPVAPDQVKDVLASQHLLLLPTLGENFGHVIAEALASGCPVLISDRTPWRGLAGAGVGWDFPLERPEAFQRVIEECIAMDRDQYRAMSHRAQEYYKRRCVDGTLIERNRQLFRAGYARSARGS